MASGKDGHKYLKKSKRHPRILRKILQQPLATNWGLGGYNPYQLVTVDKDSFEYDFVKNVFDETSRELCIKEGVSFAPEVSYARHYTSGENVFFLVKVLVANSTIGNFTTKIPPSGYDTTQNVKGTVIVKYEDDDFYPQYVIYAASLFEILRDLLI
ncbi:hypothetical protein BDFB_010479 [Asbolus verrucosus]|uniref:Uncharacterized protein n=1 Tax=Asbolus verrucosus TaxID=1661398 RepID=A0A482WB81_ASBVE|nr:hypothetical protein BDFB_010479 [Asbolus verrucosus]